MSEQLNPFVSEGVQWARGDRNVQVQGVAAGASVQVIFAGQRHRLPLRPAVVPVRHAVRSPARLMRASSGVVPFVDRDGLLVGLAAWMADSQPFSTYLIGGRGGSGKTRLGVQMCILAQEQGWVCGLLEDTAEQVGVETLADLHTARLIVVDYAETRVDQLAILLPALVEAASVQHPVRVLLLVRAGQRDGDWCAGLRNHGDRLDAVLDDTEVQVLDERLLSMDERTQLFAVAAKAFIRHEQPDPATDVSALSIPALEGSAFATPLMVVAAAYLAVHDEQDLPTTGQGLLAGLADHEDRYWRSTATAENLADLDATMRARVVATATLAGADSEEEARDLLSLLPDLVDDSAGRRGRLARWVHNLYPGPRWWNPLEPDLLAEYLVATHLSAYRGVLAGVLQRRQPTALTQPLNLYARAVPDHPALATAMTPVLTAALPSLCHTAVKQAATYTHLSSLTGTATLATALERAVSTIALSPVVLSKVLDIAPSRPNLVLGPLTLALADQLVTEYRRLVKINPTTYERYLADALNNLSNRLSGAGHHLQSLTAAEQAVALYRRLVTVDSVAHVAALAGCLNNYSICLSNLKRHPEALIAIKQAMDIYQRLVEADAATHEPHLASSLINYSNHMRDAEAYLESLNAAEQAVAVYRRLVEVNASTYEAHLATALNNYSACLSLFGRNSEALTVIEQAVAIYQRLAQANPAAYAPPLATSLNNYSLCLFESGRNSEALTIIEQAVAIHQRLAQANPAAYAPPLATSLNNYSTRLSQLGRHSEARQIQNRVDSLLRENRLI